MEMLVECCAGIDIGKDEVVACVRTPRPGGRGRRKQTRTFSSFTGSLEVMADWFTAEGVTEIAMGGHRLVLETGRAPRGAGNRVGVRGLRGRPVAAGR